MRLFCHGGVPQITRIYIRRVLPRVPMRSLVEKRIIFVQVLVKLHFFQIVHEEIFALRDSFGGDFLLNFFPLSSVLLKVLYILKFILFSPHAAAWRLNEFVWFLILLVFFLVGFIFIFFLLGVRVLGVSGIACNFLGLTSTLRLVFDLNQVFLVLKIDLSPGQLSWFIDFGSTVRRLIRTGVGLGWIRIIYRLSARSPKLIGRRIDFRVHDDHWLLNATLDLKTTCYFSSFLS